MEPASILKAIKHCLPKESGSPVLLHQPSFCGKEWEYVNKDKKGDIYFISWARIIEDFDFIKKIKNKIEKAKCSNS